MSDFASEQVRTQTQSEPAQGFRKRVSRELIAWFVVVFLVGVASGVLIVTLSGRSSPAPIIIATPPPTSTSAPTAVPPPIKVFISGEVANPAVYELPAGAIIQDIVQSAGGFTEAAERDVVNLALRLSDGMHIHVPGLEEEVSIPVVTGSEDAGNLAEGGSVNINLASNVELETLPGIGPSLAQSIVDHRDVNGAFAQIEDITDVSGIGPAKFEGLKELITVD